MPLKHRCACLAKPDRIVCQVFASNFTSPGEASKALDPIPRIVFQSSKKQTNSMHCVKSRRDRHRESNMSQQMQWKPRMNWYCDVERELSHIEGSISAAGADPILLPYADIRNRPRVLARKTEYRQADGRAEQHAAAPDRRDPRTARTALIATWGSKMIGTAAGSTVPRLQQPDFAQARSNAPAWRSRRRARAQVACAM